MAWGCGNPHSDAHPCPMAAPLVKRTQIQPSSAEACSLLYLSCLAGEARLQCSADRVGCGWVPRVVKTRGNSCGVEGEAWAARETGVQVAGDKGPPQTEVLVCPTGPLRGWGGRSGDSRGRGKVESKKTTQNTCPRGCSSELEENPER